MLCSSSRLDIGRRTGNECHGPGRCRTAPNSERGWPRKVAFSIANLAARRVSERAPRVSLCFTCRGQAAVARDLLAFLETEADALRLDDPDERLEPTEVLAATIRRSLHMAGQDLLDKEPRARSDASDERPVQP